METNETVSQFLAKLNLLYNNLLEFYNKFALSLNASSSTVTADVLIPDGSTTSIEIPAIGYYTAQVKALAQQIESLIYVNNNEIALTFQDGSVKKFEMTQLSSLVNVMESIVDTSYTAPAEFRTKTNWFFESFLNPLIFVTINVGQQAAGMDVQKFAVRRVMLLPNDLSQQQYFDQTIKGRSDLSYDTVIKSLNDEGISYHEDDNIVDMPFSVNRYSGTFSVLRVSAIQTNSVTTGTLYYLDRLFYYDSVDGAPALAYLANGDVLVTADDSEYRVTSVNKSENTVKLELQFGNGAIGIGTGVLRMRPQAFRYPELQINVGFNEREIIFVSPISSKLNLATDNWSKGFAIFTNELKITLSDGTILDMPSYYESYVSDFGMMFMSWSKEKQVPSILGIRPDAPSLTASNFKVVQTNSHLKEDKGLAELKDKISTKEKLENQIAEINKVTNAYKTKLNAASLVNEIERVKIQKDVDQNQIKKTSMVNQLGTMIQEITLGLKSQPAASVNASYSVRGFWDIPDPKTTDHGAQSVIQFKVSYRKLSKKGTAANSQQLDYSGNNGVDKQGFFSNWTETTTKIRSKEYDSTKNVYVWSTENTQDPDAVNVNQLDIPISKGEAIEIRIKSISEAGYPINPIESEWSSTITVPFPDDLEITEESAMLSDRILMDNVNVKFQQTLSEMGVDQHLANAVQTGERYLAHKLSDIASEEYTPEGKLRDAAALIKDLTQRIYALEQAAIQDFGTIHVFITDPIGNITEVQNGSYYNLFAGYYKDLITDSNNSLQHGAVMTTTYVLSIENTSQSVLELATRVMGGIDLRTPSDDSADYQSYGQYPQWIAGDTDYTSTRIYDKVPLSMPASVASQSASFRHPLPYQSSQVCGQFVYGRFKNYGLSENLYFDDRGISVVSNGSTIYPFAQRGFFEPTSNPLIFSGTAPYDSLYAVNLNGKSIDGGTTYLPFNGYAYMPYMPGTSPNSGPYGPLTAEIWSGTYTSNVADGNGAISEFSVHKDHPYIKANPLAPTAVMHPAFDGSGTQSYLPMSHALHFNTAVDEKTDSFGASYYQQCKYRRHVPYQSGPVETKNYPVKFGFLNGDEYLVGKYTCGSYLYMSPANYGSIAVIGTHPKFARREIPFRRENAVNIPIVFQFRCSDKMGYVGGWRKSGDLQNVAYTKKIGIDIYKQDVTKQSVAMYGDMFTFDVSVACQYARTTDVFSPISVNSGSMEQVNY